MEPFIHPSTKKTLQAFALSKPHAVVLTGPKGVGLYTIARVFSKKLNGLALEVSPPEGVMNVEMVRDLYDITKTKSTQRRCVIIAEADRMSHQAQNALLKLLEEPVDQTTFILLSHAIDGLLPTIRSRVQAIDVHPVPVAMTDELLDALDVPDTQMRAQLSFIAAGLPAALTELALNEAAFSARVAIVKDARTYIQGRRYERLVIAQRYAESRTDAQLLLEDALKLLERSISLKDTKILKRIEQLTLVYERLLQNGNVRLQLTAGVV